jgi:integrase
MTMARKIRVHPQRDGYLASWYDAAGERRRKAGFRSEDEALAYAVDAARGLGLEPSEEAHRPETIDELLDLFLAKHGRTVEASTRKKLERQLCKARAEFADRRPDTLSKVEIEDWKATLPAGSRHVVFKAFRQALVWALARGLMTSDPSKGIKNPRRERHERREIVPFQTWAEVDAVSEEIDQRYAAIPIFAVGTGLRPEEWIALERSDIDREARLVRVCKRFTDGELKQGTKTVPERFVPLRARVLEALDAMLPRIDTPLVFPAPKGGHINLDDWRSDHWKPALRAAGLEHRQPYATRHTFCTWAIEADTKLSYLARIMGTSVSEIEGTYFRWLQRTDDELLAAFDAYDAAANG